MKVELAGNPLIINDLKRRLSDLEASQAASLTSKATSRDFSVLELIVSAVVSGAAKTVFDLLTTAIKEAWASKKTHDALVARVGNQTIEIKTEADLVRLRQALDVR